MTTATGAGHRIGVPMPGGDMITRRPLRRTAHHSHTHCRSSTVTLYGFGKEQIKLRSRPSQLETVAYHEAGHALCAWHFEIPFSKKALSIVPSEDYSGRFLSKNVLKGANFDVDDSDRARMKMEKVVQVCLAGIQAQRRYRPSSIRSWHAQADYHYAINLLSYFAPNPAELAPYLKLLRIRVDLLFDAPYKWAQVEALAASLLERHTLSADEAADVIRGTLPRMRPDLFEPARVPE